jgi:predicted esterase YcpF (UPF0227 family)
MKTQHLQHKKNMEKMLPSIDRKNPPQHLIYVVRNIQIHMKHINKKCNIQVRHLQNECEAYVTLQHLDLLLQHQHETLATPFTNIWNTWNI